MESVPTRFTHNIEKHFRLHYQQTLFWLDLHTMSGNISGFISLCLFLCPLLFCDPSIPPPNSTLSPQMQDGLPLGISCNTDKQKEDCSSVRSAAIFNCCTCVATFRWCEGTALCSHQRQRCQWQRALLWSMQQLRYQTKTKNAAFVTLTTRQLTTVGEWHCQQHHALLWSMQWFGYIETLNLKTAQWH